MDLDSLSSRARRLLWNDSERRPRAAVRFVVAVLLVFVFLGVAAVVLPGVLTPNVSTFVRVALALLFTALPAAAALVAGYLVDRRVVADLGFGFDRDWWTDFGFGLALGAGLMTGIFVVSVVAGWFRVVGAFAGGSPVGGFVVGFALLTLQFLVVGFAEELVARGYVLTNAAEGLTGYVSEQTAVGIAVVLSSLLFGVAHLQNPNATVVSSLGITLAGVFLATGYVLTDELAIPAGVHVTWNLFQGGVYGFSVSGIGVGTTVIATAETGPDVVTGGAFGPEAGLLGVGGVVVGTALTVWYVRFRYGEVRVHPGLTVPTLRWRRGGDEEGAGEAESTADDGDPPDGDGPTDGIEATADAERRDGTESVDGNGLMDDAARRNGTDSTGEGVPAYGTTDGRTTVGEWGTAKEPTAGEVARDDDR
jgi:hypothetical protein